MRIVHITDCYLPQMGGIEVFVSQVAHFQAEAGHDVLVLTATAAQQLSAESSSLVRVLRTDKTLSLWQRSRGAGDYLAEHAAHADVVHVHISVYSPFSMRLARFLAAQRIPTVVTLHSMWTGVTPVLKFMDTVVHWRKLPIQWTAVSQVAAAPLARAIGSDEAVSVVHNAIDIQAWQATADCVRAQLDQWHAGDRPLHLVSVMRLAPRKRPLALLRMVRQLRDSAPGMPIRLTIVGEGELLPLMRWYIARHRMQGWVSLVGRQTPQQIMELYRSADIYLAPAKLEAFGIAPLEARTAGLAVLAFRQSGVSEFIRHGREGLLSDSDGQMARDLQALAADPQLLADIRLHNASHRPQQSWPAVLAQFEEIYARAVEQQLSRS